MSQVLTFANYSPARFAALQTALTQKGLRLTGNEGEVKEFGADVNYAYDGTANLTLLVKSAPHFHSFPGFILELSKAVNAIPE